MNIIFIGTSDFAVRPLELLCKNFNVLYVITQPDKKGGRGKKIIYSPVKEFCLKNKIPFAQPISINSNESKEIFYKNKPDLSIVISYGQIIKKAIYEIPKYKIINLHPSLLPKLRGPSPIQFALLNGHKETGVSIIRITDKMDAGPILCQEKVKIDYNDNFITLEKKLSEKGANLLINCIRNINNLTLKEQNNKNASYTKIIKKEDGNINWQNSAEKIRNQIRAFIKWPTAFSFYNGQMIKFYDAIVLKQTLGLEPGIIVRLSKREFGVVCGDKKLLQILSLQISGRKVLNAADFLNGVNLKTGEKFGTT